MPKDSYQGEHQGQFASNARIECTLVRFFDLATGFGLCGLRIQRFRCKVRRPLTINVPTPHNQSVYIIGHSGPWQVSLIRTALRWLAAFQT